MTPIPKIAIVGRSNVGKSTLFNRICGRRRAIVDGEPGSTRDRNYASGFWRGRPFELIDTGGLVSAPDDPLLGPADEQVQYAIAEADLLLFLVDGRSGLLPDDEAIARRLRKTGKRIIVVVNKSEGRSLVEADFSRLGFEFVLAISAEHGQGIGDLLDVLFKSLPEPTRGSVNGEETIASIIRIALVGRPNVGKSSLLNRVLGAKRAVVSPVPGTTRDAIDIEVVIEGRRFCFVDTAGIRRRKVLKRTVDHVSVLQARRSIRRADVAALVIDAAEGIHDLDVVVSRDVREMARGVVIIANKWDGERAEKRRRGVVESGIREKLRLLAYAPIAFTSALTGHGLREWLSLSVQAFEATRHRVTTGRLNRVLARAVLSNPLKTTRRNDGVKLLYGAQVGVAPPTFVLALNRPAELHFAYKRYLENRLREEFSFGGAKIVIKTHFRPH